MSLTDAKQEIFGDRTPSVLLNDVSLNYVTSVPRGRGLFSRETKRVVHALQPLSLVAHEGEFIGVVGRNGSGKSSLLRLIAGLETPTSGDIYASSQPTLIGVNGVLNNDLSGEENIEMGCLAMGLPPREIPEVKQRVMDLADIGDAIYRPMKTYSSGMAARLRFAIMLANSPRITLIDEALSTGDEATSKRYSDAMKELLGEAGTVFLVNHSAQTIEQMCTRAIWLDFGELVMDGDARAVARKYRWFAHLIANGEEARAAQMLKDSKAEGSLGYVEDSE